MEKKNPYITTIGFDKTNPRHVEVAEFLNSLQRKKADYIVNAIMEYQGRENWGGKKEGRVCTDYEEIKEIVFQILSEIQMGEQFKEKKEEGNRIEKLKDMDDEMVENILFSLEAFQEQ